MNQENNPVALAVIILETSKMSSLAFTCIMAVKLASRLLKINLMDQLLSFPGNFCPLAFRRGLVFTIMKCSLHQEEYVHSRIRKRCSRNSMVRYIGGFALFHLEAESFGGAVEA